LVLVLLADYTTKKLADAYLRPERVPHDMVGSVVRLTLAHNPRAAMGLHLGPYTGIVIPVIVLLAILLLARLYRTTPLNARLRAAALGLVIGGALGNLGDRLVSRGGVTDFIDIGVGDWRFYTFNVADVAVFCGALLLLRALDTGERTPPRT
jgi:signal peptidase II